MARKKTVVIVEERTEICRECRHAFFGADVITCRRHPPVPVLDVSEGEVVTVFPYVAADLWCGDFGAKLSS